MAKKNLPPAPTYPCGHCGKLIHRVQALRQAGYCEACEFMTRRQVQWDLGISQPTAMKRIPFLRIGGTRTVLYARADVEQYRARLMALKTSWLARCAA